ncbi:MAG: C39 family peptidase [Alphaproteobacteria bacterium]
MLNGLLFLFFICGAWLANNPSLQAAPIAFGTQTLRLPVKSLNDIKQDFVIRQQHDFTCGSAALATILYYNFHLNITEQDIIRSIIADGKNLAQAKREGFSLLDMKRFVERNGLTAKGYKELSLTRLQEIGLPAIIAINREGYRHFVVVRDIKNNHILIANPALGNEWLNVEKFNQLWGNRIGFYIFQVVDGKTQTLRNNMAAMPQEINIPALENPDKPWLPYKPWLDEKNIIPRHPLQDYIKPRTGTQ